MRCVYCNALLSDNDMAMEHAGVCPVMNSGGPDDEKDNDGQLVAHDCMDREGEA